MAGILWSSNNAQQEFDALLEKATSDLLPAQTPVDLVACLQMADMVRSSTVQPASASRSIQKRLKHDNPNVQLLALDVLDICIKNGGTPFLLQAGSRDMADDLESLGGHANAQVREKALKDLQDWASAFQQKGSNLRDTDLVRTYKRMRRSTTFPPKDDRATAAMVDSLSAPEWDDAPYCTRCRTDFGTFNRKHHCRNCGHVFDQACSSSTAPLPHYGILQPVRVCDGCLKKIKEGKGATVAPSAAAAATTSASGVKRSKSRRQQEDEDLEKAIAASLRESEPQPQPRSGYHPAYSTTKATAAAADKDDDADLAAAIAASLRDVAVAPSAPAESYAELYPSSAAVPSATEDRPRLAPLPSYDLTPDEQAAMDAFTNTFAHARPSYFGYRERDMYEQAARAQPGLERGLEDAHRRRDMLVDMNRKLADAARMYESLLDGRIRTADRYHQYQHQPIAQPAMMTNGYHYQQPAAYAVPQPNPGQPLPHFAPTSPPPLLPQQQQQQPQQPVEHSQMQTESRQQHEQEPAGWYRASSFPAAPKAPLLPSVPNHNTTTNPWSTERRRAEEEEDDAESVVSEQQQQQVGELIELAPAAALSQVSPQYGSQRDVMTLLAPPPFPTQFDSSDPVSETDRSTSEDWKIKTDRERYIDALERKLAQTKSLSTSPSAVEVVEDEDEDVRNATDDDDDDDDDDGASEERQRLLGNTRKSQYDAIRVTPATPSSKEERRISFSQSVRISGGIRAASPPTTTTRWNRTASLANTASSSGLPSRSSSPCSSIYAPLQPNAENCSTPFNPATRPLLLSANASSAEQQEFYDYHGLLLEQKRKKAKTAARRRRRSSSSSLSGEHRKKETLWSRFIALFSSSSSSSESDEEDTRTQYGSDLSTADLSTPRTATRRRSSLSITSDDDDEDDPAASNAASVTSVQGDSLLKTEADVMFGPAPRRWLTLAWWRWRVRDSPLCMCMRSAATHEDEA